MSTPIQKLEQIWLKAWQRELGPDATLTDEEQTELHKCRQEASEQEEELQVTDKLLEARQEVLDAIPECPIHGSCIPHALEWIESMKSKSS